LPQASNNLDSDNAANENNSATATDIKPQIEQIEPIEQIDTVEEGKVGQPQDPDMEPVEEVEAPTTVNDNTKQTEEVVVAPTVTAATVNNKTKANNANLRRKSRDESSVAGRNAKKPQLTSTNNRN